VTDSRSVDRCVVHGNIPIFPTAQADPKDLIFAPPHFKKEKKKTPPHNFLSRFLSQRTFGTFAFAPFYFFRMDEQKQKSQASPAIKNSRQKIFLPAETFLSTYN